MWTKETFHIKKAIFFYLYAKQKVLTDLTEI